MDSLLLLSLLPVAVFASLSIDDPSDVIDPTLWEVDNAIYADYSDVVLTMPRALEGAYEYDSDDVTLEHVTLSVNANDTSVVLVNDSTITMEYVNILKYGYSSNLYEASFWGFNAAVNVANASTAYLNDVNITVHNGAANVYAYGLDTVVEVSDSWLYSSGPVSHGLYAAEYATVIGKNIQHYSGGMRSSSFSGDAPAGYVYVYDSIAHAVGIGSATYYALGTIYAENVLSESENGPVVFMDGNQNATLIKCDATAGLLGGVAIFSSSSRLDGAILNLQKTKITTVGDIPGLWFGNVVADVTLEKSKLETESGILVVANFSSITQDFDHYAGYSENENLQPAELDITITESTLVGDIVAYNSSSISWDLGSYSSWTGAAVAGYGDAYFDITLDSTSNWTLTADSTIQALVDSTTDLSNIFSNGYTLYYNSSVSANSWLDGETISLSGGGSAVAY